jgi:hypothetical protein
VRDIQPGKLVASRPRFAVCRNLGLVASYKRQMHYATEVSLAKPFLMRLPGHRTVRKRFSPFITPGLPEAAPPRRDIRCLFQKWIRRPISGTPQINPRLHRTCNRLPLSSPPKRSTVPLSTPRWPPSVPLSSPPKPSTVPLSIPRHRYRSFFAAVPRRCSLYVLSQPCPYIQPPRPAPGLGHAKNQSPRLSVSPRWLSV